MRRRDFIAALGGAAVAWPLAARAQQALMPVIGLLNSASAEGYADRIRAFRQGLSETGYVEGQNVSIEYRWAQGQSDRLPALAADLVHRQVSVIVSAGGLPAALAAKAATRTIPIVFFLGNDPVEAGLVASLGRPSGNLTGVTTLNVQLGPKRLELLHEVLPSATQIALLVNPTNPTTETVSKDLRAAASTLGLQLHVLHASSEREIDNAFATLAHLRGGGLVIAPDVLFNAHIEQLGILAVRYAVPTIYQYEFATAGGLMSYGSSLTAPPRQVGVYTGRILKGEKPAELPVHQATKVDLSINLKTAKALGVTVPLSLLGRADQVIE